MGGRKHIPYEGLLDIPEGKVGDFSVKHIIEKKGALLQTSSPRTAMYGGHDGKTISYDHPTRWHELLEGEGRWTSDLPIEQWQQREAIVGFRGRVLVGGLGLGVVVRMLAQYRNVTRIEVVEKSPEVIALVGEHVALADPRIHIEQADLGEFLWSTGGKKQPLWDFAFFDIWTGDNEHTFYETVLPLTRLARPQVKHQITNWNEDVMRGQVQQSLLGPLQMLRYGQRGYHPSGELSLALLAEETDDFWHSRIQPFYAALLRVNAVMTDDVEWNAARFLAWKWSREYDGTDEYGARWLQHFDWGFAQEMAKFNLQNP